jgi:WD40 repeat protein
VRSWSVADGAALGRLVTGYSDGAMQNAAMLAVSSDGTLLAVGARDSTVRIVDAKTLKVLRDGTRLATGATSGTLFVWPVP